MQPAKKYPILSTLSFVITLIFNYGAAFGWFGASQEEISNMYRNYFTPASFTFSIWGVIYTAIIAFLVYQFYLLAKDRYQPHLLDRLNLYFIISCVLNILWNVLWVSDLIFLSTLVIFLFTIVLGLLTDYIGQSSFRSYSQLIPITFALYFGWLTVATVTNVAAWLIKIEWSMWGLPEHLWACLTYIGVGFLAGFLVWRIKNPIFLLPIMWAYAGIIATLVNHPPRTPIHPLMPYVAGAVIVGLAVVFVVRIVYNLGQHDHWLGLGTARRPKDS